MTDPPIIVEHNHQANPGDRRSLLVRYGTLAIDVTQLDRGLAVHALRNKPGRGEWTERAMDAESIEHARQLARRLVRELGP